MGQFDKSHAPKTGSQKSKALMAVALALALGCVIFFQVWKSTPQAASGAVNAGSTDPDPNALLAPPRSVSQELDELAKDPTTPYLRGDRTIDAAFLTPTHDPFRMADKWRASLTRNDVTPNPPDPRIDTHVAPPLPQGADVASIKVTGIFRDKDKYTAIVNGVIARAGMILKNVRICEILEDRIVVQNAAYPEGPRSEVILKSKFGG